MVNTDCVELEARAQDLHALAGAHMEIAKEKRSSGSRFVDEVVEAARYERQAEAVEVRIAEEC